LNNHQRSKLFSVVMKTLHISIIHMKMKRKIDLYHLLRELLIILHQ